MPIAASLFAALDAQGAIRFVGDVPSGAACGCICPACASPLVARKGDVRTWHFAHEASQERPECVAGAMNLLHRLAVQYLKSLPRIELPRYEQRVSRMFATGSRSEEVGWDAQPLSVDWLEPAPGQDAVAMMRLDTGLDASLEVHIGDYPPKPVRLGDKIGRVVFYSSLPVDSDLRKELYVLQHLKRDGRIGWLYQPDVFGFVDSAAKRLAQQFREDERDRQERAARQLQQYAWPSRDRSPAAPSWPAAPVSVPVPTPALPPEAPAWAALRAPNRPYFAYRLQDGTAWAVFELRDGRYGVACFAGETDWSEYVPASVATFDPELRIFVTPVYARAAGFFERLRTATRISTHYEDILAMA